MICHIHRIVVAIREHVAAEEALAGGSEAVRVDEAAEVRVVVTALQVIESRLLGTVVARESKISLFSASPAKDYSSLTGLFVNPEFVSQRNELIFIS